jgi:hypothetical protein
VVRCCGLALAIVLLGIILVLAVLTFGTFEPTMIVD